jgi:hypothetical protein
MNIASLEEGVDRGDTEFDTALGAYSTTFSQGQVAVRRELVLHYLNQVEADDHLAIVIVRRGTLGTGGSGVAVAGGGPGSTVVHEWGHAFGMLLDEYTSDVGYQGGPPTGFNIANSENPDEIPWKHWLDADERGVGMIPGGAGRATGVWRPTGGPCAMASGGAFCLVCREALVASIYGFVSPLDDYAPRKPEVAITAGEDQLFEVTPMTVVGTPSLQVEFFLEEVEAPEPVVEEDHPLFRPIGSRTGSPSRTPRSSRQMIESRPRWHGEPLVLPDGEPLRAKRRKGAWQVETGKDLAPGYYELTAVVRDPTEWVLKPEWLDLITDFVRWKLRVTQ